MEQHRFDTDRPAAQRPLAGIALRFVAVASLAVMFACVKLAAARGVHVVESLFFRQLVAAAIAALWAWSTTGLGALRTRRVGIHASRMVVGLSAMALNFLAMILLPLAEATAIGYAVPLFATLFAALLLREPTGRWRWGAVLIGFAGVLLIARPGTGDLPLIGVGVAVAAALMTALVTIIIRKLGATESAVTTVFWFTASSLVPMGLLMLFFAGAHDPVTWGIVALLGLAGGVGQMALTGALRLAPVAVVMPVDYLGLIFAVIFGFYIFGDAVAAATWVGAPIIIASGLVIAWREHRLGRAKPVAPAAN